MLSVFSTREFNKSEWLAPVAEERASTCYRGGMAKDIQNNYLKPGMSKEDVIELLGKPDWSSDYEFRYFLGMCSGFQFDYDLLHVYFDPHKKFVKSEIFQH